MVNSCLLLESVIIRVGICLCVICDTDTHSPHILKEWCPSIPISEVFVIICFENEFLHSYFLDMNSLVENWSPHTLHNVFYITVKHQCTYMFIPLTELYPFNFQNVTCRITCHHCQPHVNLNLRCSIIKRNAILQTIYPIIEYINRISFSMR